MIDRLQKMIETNSIMNMLFYGKVGTGKASAARLFEDSTDLYVLGGGRMFVQWDGSSVKDEDRVRKNIKGSLGLAGFKICFLDQQTWFPNQRSKQYPASLKRCHTTAVFSLL